MNAQEKINYWINEGFTRDEAKMMVKGSTLNECRQRHGGVWQVRQVQWPQAISAAHAEKLYKHQFGREESARFIPAPKR